MGSAKSFQGHALHRSRMPFCGQKLSVCCSLLSCWGIVQLLFMGILFYTESPAFIEDLPLHDRYGSPDQYLSEMHRLFKANAFNCLIAACLYIATLGVSSWQFYLNQKTSFQV